MRTLDFINVGYGDAILVQDTEEKFVMLVDCGDISTGDGGPGSARVSAAEFLRKKGIDTLSVLVLTHLHRDHSGGLTELLSQVKIKELWVNYLPPQTYWGKTVPVVKPFSAGARCLLESLNIYLAALQTMKAQGTEIRLIEASGDTYALTQSLTAWVYQEVGEVQARQQEIWQHVLDGAASGEELDELDRFINNTSLRLRLNGGGKTVELPGDMYASCWEKHQLTPCDIMKLPHHGHGDSVTEKLLDMLQPKHVVISVSDSRTDNCPAVNVVNGILNRGVSLYATDAVVREGFSAGYHESVWFEL